MLLSKTMKRSLKYLTIRAGLEVSALPGVRFLQPSLGGRGVIFTLHHVRPPEKTSGFAPNAHLSITPEFLDVAIEAALECGLLPAHLHDLPQLTMEPHDGRKFFAFTLDDGYRNNAEYAAPVFRKFAVPYTIFITPGFVERTRSIWWETAEALAKNNTSFRFDFGQGEETVAVSTHAQKIAAFIRFEQFVSSTDEDEAVARIDLAARRHGIDSMAIVDRLVMNKGELAALSSDPLAHIGAHTMTHVNMRRVSNERLHQEISQSTSRIEGYVGQRPRSFSYPYGWATAAADREMKATLAAGFPVAVTTRPGVLTPQSLRQPTALPRVSLNGHFQKKRYVKALISGLPFRLI
ncbi:polysaccharide deacetylase family protein [Agrobacterium tumefaciens]|uniref:polysaccharide deacetylase family protein n=1 Tax=Agrobacterium tumefaciens TaxID=358 RepID=UPI0021CEE841|nr:polysaccharide deacetylase family protein [Agrobacterium tumefaciens]UXS04256.1 polysaccharide deacetylase family protein [Agrobacterium tumefaciens]